MRQLRITIRSLRFRSPRGMRGRSDVAVRITLDGAAVGDPAGQWTVRRNERISFDAATYSTTIDVEGRTHALELVVEPRFDEPGNAAIIGGAVRHRVPWPFLPRQLDISRREFVVEWEIEQVNPAPATPSPSGLFACREDRNGAVLYNTAGAANQMLRLEVHQVIPVPRGRGGPRRPTFPRAIAPEWRDGSVAYTAAELSGGTDLNLIENPAVIPIMPAGTTLDATNCARFRVTFYRPNTFNFAEDDARLTWSIVSTGGGSARFFGRQNGRKVSVHGVAEGEIGLELRFEGVLVATYRALVLPFVTIPFRVTILYGHATSRGMRPRSAPADVQRHMLMCNRFLWQLGVKLEPFDSVALGWLPRRVAAASIVPVAGSPGFFTANVSGRWTRGIGDSLSAAINSLPYVFNFGYIKSDSGGNLGVGCYTEVGGSTFLSDEGTPSTSWVRPSGVTPDGAARPVRMRRLPNHGFFRNSAFPHRFAMYITDANTNDMNFAGTIAHELGHVIGLNHRVEDPALVATGNHYDDYVQYPPRQNVMHFNEPSETAQDFDILQARQVRLCPLLNPPAGALPVAGGAAAAPPPRGAGGAPAEEEAESAPAEEEEE